MARALERPLVVQQSFPTPRPTTNPYIVMLKAAVEGVDRVELRTFSWRRALLGRYDVFHVHWPEILLSGSTPLKAAVRQLLTALLLGRLRLARIPVVRTLHNLERPSGLNCVQHLLLAWFERRTTLVIRLNPDTPEPSDRLSVLIRHGHYRDWFARFPRPPAVPGRLAYVGLIRRYKGVDRLVGAFRDLSGEVSLEVAGKPSGAELVEQLTSLAAGDERITFTFAFLSEEELVGVVSRGELVVLPYREMHNSGGALAALSLGRPVLVPANEVNARLAEEVGDGWVLQYQGELDATDLRKALDEVQRAGRSSAPDLTAREWDRAGDQHVEAYRLAVAALRPARGGTRAIRLRVGTPGS